MDGDGLTVVGASLAGLRAVEAARKAGYPGRVTLIGAEEHLPYDRPPLSKQFLGAAEPADPVFRDERALRDELGVELRLGQAATAIDTRARAIGLDGSEVPYEALVIATGASARTVPGFERLEGACTLRTLDDARQVRRALDAGARTVVIGAGFIGSEVASSARARGLPVTLVEAAPVPLARSVGSEMGKLLAELHVQAGTDLRLGVGVAGLDGDGAVRGVILTDGTKVAADLVVVGIGASPGTGWLQDSGIDLDTRDGGVLCDSTLATSVPGVYAAGDVCHWVSELFGRRLRLEHWTSAAEQGALAARNALAPETAKAYDTVPYFWSDWYDSRIQFVGEPAADEITVVDHQWEAGKLLALYRTGDRLTGALTVNRPALVMKFRRMIADRTSWSRAVEFGREKTKP
ncbi:FAD-dependent oxidoreductase [Amycolatopsis acidiphila]|uniref:Oxidoreductase n=1 Tax=Amycolatopsis acidiphila TaxID=715473 RepID=A0A558ACX5_9PSEU|nr:FAD-dependent oxidoreductase [Amycolatopsis acidiphila]TVT22119.1 oxidoreductase [Amycolatopsis acidiphila]UIJ61684.1 FAD-dependent oxidoreductase [Amycolatopsis acidiphila]GHG58430.1 ferredoxin reductase [Amycolatopsis acidiphila]